MRITQKKVVELVKYLKEHIAEYQELIDAGYVEYYKQQYVLKDTLEYVTDLFAIDEHHDNT
jgi:predicted translin family RNA/ssDNA-binding protein